LNHFISRGLILLILISSISSSNVIKDGFSTPENNSNGFATNKESRDEEGQTPRPDLAEEEQIPGKGTARSIEASKNPSLLGNISYNALPVPNFLNYYINKSNEQINGIVCFKILQEPNNPENIIKIPCTDIFIFIANNNIPKNYNITNSSSIIPFFYNDESSYQLKLISKLITELYPKTKDYNCGIIKEYVSFKTEIVSCTNVGILMR
jgi:hypothetical protein